MILDWIGKAITTIGAFFASDCLLHLFANDAWMTAANNSGGLEMTLQRLPADEPAQGPVWTFASRRSKGGREWIPANTEQWRWSRSA